uniref:Uncharacterized protein n=1 Tax=Physcomitrium patens TaxID=3218 RepID=A0A2K1IQJ6_PHYPA|nr:hypothetical protein PHYPA_025667 [Physcomitrium patens]
MNFSISPVNAETDVTNQSVSKSVLPLAGSRKPLYDQLVTSMKSDRAGDGTGNVGVASRLTMVHSARQFAPNPRPVGV